MLIALLATLMFFAMLATTFNAMRNEMQEAKIRVRTTDRYRRAHPTNNDRPW